LVIASAGNCGSNDAYFDPTCGNKINPVTYPASFPSVLSVASTGPNDEHPAYSSFGPFIKVSAPGGNSKLGERTAGNSILSTCWRAGTCNYKNDYAVMEGTSMAAPHVSALAALIWSIRPDLKNDQVAAIIVGTAADIGAPGPD